MDLKFVCPRCQKRNWKKTNRKDKLKCLEPYCGYVTEKMSDEDMEEVLNYVPIPPTPIELASEEISNYFDLDDYDKKDLVEILEKYFK